MKPKELKKIRREEFEMNQAEFAFKVLGSQSKHCKQYVSMVESGNRLVSNKIVFSVDRYRRILKLEKELEELRDILNSKIKESRGLIFEGDREIKLKIFYLKDKINEIVKCIDEIKDEINKL